MNVHLPALLSTLHIMEISPHTSKRKHSLCPQLHLTLEPERQCGLMKRQWTRSGNVWLVVLTLLLTSSETLNNSLCKSESRSDVSNSLWPHGLYSPWNSPGQNTGVGSLSLLQWIFPTQESNRGLLHCRWILYQLSYQGSPIHYKFISSFVKKKKKSVLVMDGK